MTQRSPQKAVGGNRFPIGFICMAVRGQGSYAIPYRGAGLSVGARKP